MFSLCNNELSTMLILFLPRNFPYLSANLCSTVSIEMIFTESLIVTIKKILLKI